MEIESVILLFFFVVAILLVTYLYYIPSIKKKCDGQLLDVTKKLADYQKKFEQHDENVRAFAAYKTEKEKQFIRTEFELKEKSKEWALSELEKFKSEELVKYKGVLEKNALADAANVLEKWKYETEAKIRQDAANRSYAVNFGKITEHLVPFHTKFPFNPKDVRFIGSPIDLIVFDGASEESDNIIVYFVEIKTGNSRLTDKQKKIKSAIQNREVIWHEINPSEMDA